MRWSDVEMFRAINSIVHYVFRAGHGQMKAESAAQVAVPFKYTLQAVSSRSSSSGTTGGGSPLGGSHPGVPGDWSSSGRVQEEMWIRTQEKEVREDEERLYQRELGKIEGELEDLLIDEYMTDEAKAKIIHWKMKLVDCLTSSTHSHSSTALRTPSEAVLDTQSLQSLHLSELDNLLHIESVDLSDKAKRALVDWKLNGDWGAK